MGWYDNCQVCKKKMDKEEMDELVKTMPDTSALPWSPKGWDGSGICSIECQKNAIKMNACWNMKNNLKNMNNMSFKTFNDIMQFNEAGGYAEQKWQIMRTNPWAFVLSCDVDNFLKIVLAKV